MKLYIQGIKIQPDGKVDIDFVHSDITDTELHKLYQLHKKGEPIDVKVI